MVAESSLSRLPNPDLSRRTFLRLAGLGTAGALAWAIHESLPMPNPYERIGKIQDSLESLGDLETSKIADNVYSLELNGHALEKRGPELARYIWNIVDAAFNHPGPNNPYDAAKKAILCGVADSLTQVVQLLVEVESRTKPGVKRIASVIFGQDAATGQWRTITALYKDGDLESMVQKQSLRGLTAAACNGNLPPPSQLLAP
jgi:hypothetical protein